MSTKKKNLRFRPIAILPMASVIALSVASAFGVDVGDYSYSYNLTTKEGTITSYRGSSESISIPRSFTVAETYKDEDDGEMHIRHHTITVTGIGSSVFANKTFITSVSFHNKLKSIGSSAFRGCTGLTAVDFPEGLTSVGDHAFQGCTGLTSVETPCSLTFLGKGAFYDCKGLEEAVVNGTELDLYNQSEIFFGCSALKNVVFGDGVTRLYNWSTTDWYSGTFKGCSSLEHVSVGTGVTVVPRYFLAKCGSSANKMTVSFAAPITRVGVNGLANGNITNLAISLSSCTVENNSFNSCPAVNFGNIDFGEVVSIDYEAFKNCVNLVGGLDLSLLSSIGNSAFQGCTGLTGVRFADSLKTIGSSAFRGCTGLTAVDFPEGLTSVGDHAFQGCTGLTSVETPCSLTFLGKGAFYDCKGLEEAVVNGTELDLYDQSEIFFGCSALKSVVFGDGVTRLYNWSTTDWYSGTFKGCSSLEYVSVGAGVTVVPRYFLAKCGSSANKMTVSFAAPITSVGEYGLANGNITNLTITLNNCHVDGGAFENCPAVSLGNIDFTQISYIGYNGFKNCYNIKGSIDLTNLTTINSSVFQNCTGITEVEFGSTLTSIGSSAFSGCVNASSFAFAGTPPSVGSSAFNKVKSGAIGTYTAAYKTAWDAVINANGTWNGLIMSANKPVLSNGGCNVATGSFTLTWANDDVLMPPGMKYEIRRGFSDNYGASEVLTNGYDQLSFVDKDFYTTGGVSRIWYWIKPEHPLFEASEPIVTRNRHAILIGLSQWEYSQMPDTGGASNVEKFHSLATSLGGFEDRNIHMCVNSNAKSNDVEMAFADVSQVAIPGDICIFYINTHGGILENGTSVLSLYDGDYTEMQLAQDISQLDAVNKDLIVVGIVSACHSGALFDNPDQSVSRTSWYLQNGGYAQSLPNVAWITSSGARTSGYGVFNDFLLDYGWERRFASENGSMSLQDLAIYTKHQYDTLFSDIIFEGEEENKSVRIWNEQILSKVMICPQGMHTPSVLLPSQFTVRASVNQRSKIVVDWSPAEYADKYYVFYRYATTEYLSFKTNLLGIMTSCDFTIVEGSENPAQKILNDFLLLSNQETPLYFIVKAVNGAGIRKGIPFDDPNFTEVEGWIDNSYAITFKADGHIIVPPEGWMGVYPDEYIDPLLHKITSMLEKPFSRGESVLIQTLPTATRDGYTFQGWVDKNNRLLEINTVISASMTYTAKWTQMTKSWLDSYPQLAASSNGDIATAANMTAANGCRTVGECYALGIDPEDPNDDLKITDFKIEDGKPVITINHTKDGSGNSFEPRIKTLGKANLTDADWVDVTDKDQSAYRFFKVTVDMP